MLDEPRKSDIQLDALIRKNAPNLAPHIMSDACYGHYHYKSKTREGEWFNIGLTNKRYISLYLMAGDEKTGGYLAELRQHQADIKLVRSHQRPSDVDRKTLEDLLRRRRSSTRWRSASRTQGGGGSDPRTRSIADRPFRPDRPVARQYVLGVNALESRQSQRPIAIGRVRRNLWATLAVGHGVWPWRRRRARPLDRPAQERVPGVWHGSRAATRDIERGAIAERRHLQGALTATHRAASIPGCNRTQPRRRAGSFAGLDLAACKRRIQLVN
jgi:hypothetical protein